MELTTDLAVCVEFNGTTAGVVPRALRDPTPLDWQEWAPTIKARYKNMTVRVFVDEMKAAGLQVTYVLLQIIRVYHMSATHKG
jgi:hypothetical protein